MDINIPPIKIQGIKIKLIPWIKSIVPDKFNKTWIEPFMGSGSVAFNIAPKNAILCDTNPHLINFYKSIYNNKITPKIVKQFLEKESNILLQIGEKHYYNIRDRFNTTHNSLDFLFLNRACFNGIIRFNRNGNFNVPFCKNINRFKPNYINKIVNQVEYINNLLKVKKFIFKHQSFQETIINAGDNDIIYCDPPYIDRCSTYYNTWNEQDEKELFNILLKSKCKFILSTWHHNNSEKNKYIELFWNKFNILTYNHIYYVGGKKENRCNIVEAIITNF